jgi:hypothetical protein
MATTPAATTQTAARPKDGCLYVGDVKENKGSGGPNRAPQHVRQWRCAPSSQGGVRVAVQSISGFFGAVAQVG